MHHPGFSCPLCRTFADLEADVEQDEDVELEEDDDDTEEELADPGPGQPSYTKRISTTDSVLPGSRPSIADSFLQGALPEPDFGPDWLDINLESFRSGLNTPPILNVSTSLGGPLRLNTTGADVFHSDLSSFPGRHSTTVSRMPHRGSSPAQNGLSAAFSPPSAGDFDADIRRTSLFVHGADGHAMQIPVTGRSRPGSVFDLEVSDSAPSASSNRARSIRGLRKRTTSMNSLGAAGVGASSSSSPMSRNGIGHLRGKTMSHHYEGLLGSDSDEEDWNRPSTFVRPGNTNSAAGRLDQVLQPLSSDFSSSFSHTSARTDALNTPHVLRQNSTVSDTRTTAGTSIQSHDERQINNTTPPNLSAGYERDLKTLFLSRKGKEKQELDGMHSEESGSSVRAETAVVTKGLSNGTIDWLERTVETTLT